MKRATWESPYRFSPEEHEQELTAIVKAIEDQPNLDPPALQRILNKFPKNGNAIFSKSEIIRGYRYLAQRHRWTANPETFIEKVRMKPVRTISGVTPVTVLTQPYPCPGQCIFCPNDLRMPKSYLSLEPGAQRAGRHTFDPYQQVLARLRTLDVMGHPIDKIELIILGGTWSFYPESYQFWFIKRCFDAMNEFDEVKDLEGEDFVPPVDFEKLQDEVDGRSGSSPYNDLVSGFLREQTGHGLVHHESVATWEDLQRAHRVNETGPSRCVGLSVETRPDHVDEQELLRIRRLGATKVQIGIQSLSDKVLALNKRGHDVATTSRAVRLLRQAGFKIQAHWMPNLYGSTPEKDIEDFERLFSSPEFRPDELKIYPCSLIESAELMVHYEAGNWRPYTQQELTEVLTECLQRVAPYCRVSRVIRDIPGEDILVGNKLTNFRNLAEEELAKRNWTSRDIRSREIRDLRAPIEGLVLEELPYETSAGREFFLQFVTDEDRIAGFLRLCLPDETSFIEELGECALIREVHVYGAAVNIGKRGEYGSQHLGLGTRLIDRAKEMALNAGYKNLAVISSVGTREYYRRLGFQDGELYQHCKLVTQEEGGSRK
jgi:elongator complex protein 3